MQSDDQLAKNGIPMFGKNGIVLGRAQREEIARMRGQCTSCGIKVQNVKGLKKPITNSDVWEGICIRCFPSQVPSEVLEQRLAFTLAFNEVSVMGSDGQVLTDDEKMYLREEKGYCLDCRGPPVLLYDIEKSEKNNPPSTTKKPRTIDGVCAGGICFACFLNIDIGSPMTLQELANAKMRKKRGECVTCGQKCFKKKVFKMIPLDIPGLVSSGKCLKCTGGAATPQSQRGIVNAASLTVPYLPHATDLGSKSPSRSPSGSRSRSPSGSRSRSPSGSRSRSPSGSRSRSYTSSSSRSHSRSRSRSYTSSSSRSHSRSRSRSYSHSRSPSCSSYEKPKEDPAAAAPAPEPAQNPKEEMITNGLIGSPEKQKRIAALRPQARKPAPTIAQPPQDGDTALALRLALAYNDVSMLSDGRVLTPGGKLRLRKKKGYCLACEGPPVLLYNIKDYGLFTTKKPRTMDGICANGICFICYPKKDPNTSPVPAGGRSTIPVITSQVLNAVQQRSPKLSPDSTPVASPAAAALPSHVFVEDGSDRELAERRAKRGECETCGIQTHKISAFGKKTPLTKEGKVLKGCCLHCQKEKGGLDVPLYADVAVAKPEDMKLFSTAQAAPNVALGIAVKEGAEEPAFRMHPKATPLERHRQSQALVSSSKEKTNDGTEQEDAKPPAKETAKMEESEMRAAIVAVHKANSLTPKQKQTLIQEMLKGGRSKRNADITTVNFELMVASRHGHTDTVKNLLGYGADITNSNKDGNTALMLASKNGRTDTVKHLLDKGADWKITNRYGRTALMLASSSGSSDAVQLLLETGADWEIADHDGRTALMLASSSGSSDAVKLLLEKGADWEIADNGGNNALMLASRNGHTDTVKHLLEKGADWELAEKDGNTGLMLASRNGHTDTVKLLLDKGADWKIANKNGHTALYLAKRQGDTGIVELMLQRDYPEIPVEWMRLLDSDEIKDVDNETFITRWLQHEKKESFINWKEDFIENGMTMMHCAIKHERWDLTKSMLDHGADVTIVDKNGWTALMLASSNGYTDTVKHLLDHGADVTIVDKDGNTALMLASRNGRTDTVKHLLDKGADWKIANQNGHTAFGLAEKQAYTGIVELLLQCDHPETPVEWMRLLDPSAMKNVKSETFITKWLQHEKKEIFISWKDDSFQNGMTMLHCAIKVERWEIAKSLLDHGADVTIVDKDGNTALMLASRNGHTDTVKHLLDKGAHWKITSRFGHTALDLAKKQGHTGIEALLLQHDNPEIPVEWMRLLDSDEIKDVDNEAFITRWLQHEKKESYINWKEDFIENGMTMLNLAIKYERWDLAKSLLDHGADVTIVDNNGWTALMLASEKCHVDTVELLLNKGADCKIMNNQGRTVFAEVYFAGLSDLVDLLLEKAPLFDIIHDVAKYSAFASKFFEMYQANREIVNWLDEDGRTVRQVACKECREAILFLGRYDMDEKAKYESPTCKILHALDYGDRHGLKLKEPRRVAMKFMDKKEHFLNEIRARRNDNGSQRFSSEFVTPDLASYSADEDPEYAAACKVWNTNGTETDFLPAHCIVMPLGERSLLESMNAENLSAKHKDLQRREILMSLCKVFSYLHEAGYVHGDIKPHNVVRHMGENVTWKAIDFDSCTKVGNIVGLKLTTGSAPPEMLKTIKGKDANTGTEKVGESQVILRQPGGVLDESELVLADPSFDVWSYGILLYQLVTGRTFFHCNLQGNVDDTGLHEFANLTEDDIHKKLDGVVDVNARVLLSKILRLDPKERPTMAEIGRDYYFHPSDSPQGRKADFFGKQGFGDTSEDNQSVFATSPQSRTTIDHNDGSKNMQEIQLFLSSKSEFSYFQLRDEDKDWSDKLLNSEVETFHFDKLGAGMGEKPNIIDGDTIYNNTLLRNLLCNKGPDYFMGFLVEYFGLYKILNDAHEVCQGIKANLVSNVKDLKGIFVKLFVRGKGLNDVVRGTLFCNNVDQFKYVGRQLNERYGHSVYIKPPKKEAGAWPIPKLLIYGKRKLCGRCMSVEIQFSTVYMHLATHASNNHLVYEAIRESTGYLGDKDEDFQEFLQRLNKQYIDTEGFLRNHSAEEGRFEVLMEQVGEIGSNETHREESTKQYISRATGFITSGRICCGDRRFQFMSPSDRFQRFSESSFVVNKSLTLLSSHSYWSEESCDLECKSVEFAVSFKGRGLAIAGIGTARCLHGSTATNGGGVRCSVHVGRSKFVVRRSGIEEISCEKKLPDQERAKISFQMRDGVLSVSFVGRGSTGEEEIESVHVSMPSDQRYYLYMRAPPGVHDVKFHDIDIPVGAVHWM